jgi:RimJ/RimL family protein N-acetyltransferase
VAMSGPGENILIRRASLDDAHACSKYMSILADENLQQLSGLRPTPEQERAFLQKASDECALVLLAMNGADVIGTLDLWRGESAIKRHSARLGMSLLAPYWRRGLGRELLQRAIIEAKQWADFCRIDLEVSPTNEQAIRLYESAGFVREGTIRKAVHLRSEFRDLVRMALVW